MRQLNRRMTTLDMLHAFDSIPEDLLPEPYPKRYSRDLEDISQSRMLIEIYSAATLTAA